MPINSTLEAIRKISHGKVFFRQKIPEFRCMRRKTIDILITSRNGHHD